MSGLYFNATMGWFKQLYLSWIILCAATAYVSCQELTSTLREGNRTCPGEEVMFNCTVRGPSSLSSLNLAWSSAKYISRSLQLSTTNGLGAEETSTDMDGVITATATVTNIANVAGELILESMLRITATVASTVTCTSGADRGTASIEFFISAVPGVPQMISAAEIFRDNICIILVTWVPPANSNASDIDQYIVYVPSRNIREVSFSTLNTLTLLNCGDDIHIQVAAVNRVGCVGMNSSEVRPAPFDSIPTAPITSEGGSATTTTEGGSASTSSPLGAGPIAGIIIVVLIGIVCICIYCSGIIVYIYRHFKEKGTKRDGERKGKGLIGHGPSRIQDDGNGMKLIEVRANEEEYNTAVVQLGPEKHEELKEQRGNLSPMECLIDLYIHVILKALPQTYSVNGMLDETSDSGIINAVGALRAALKKNEVSIIKDRLVRLLVILKDNNDEIRGALEYLMKLISENMSGEVKRNLQELREKASKTTLLVRALDIMIDEVLDAPPEDIKESLLSLCDALFDKLLKLPPKQEDVLKKFNIKLEDLTSLTAKDQESEGKDVQVKMLVTHIRKMPKRAEKEEFLVVDMLNMNTLRVRHIDVIEGSIKMKNYEDFKRDEVAEDETTSGLVHFIDKCITKFINNKNIGEELPITFTSQRHVTSGKLIHWTREPEGTPEEIKKGIKVDTAAMVNDATGILLAMGNKDPDCRIGLSLRNRANACYMEELGAGNFQIVNTDWGAFDDNGQLDQWRTNYDHDGKERIDCDGQLVDNPSNTKQQLFEKMISEEQQGAIVYRVFKDLISKKKLFGAQTVTKLNFNKFEDFCKGSLKTIEEWDIEMCKRLLKHHFEIEASDEDYVVIQRVCEAVSTRAARLAAAGIVAIAKKIDVTYGCTVAVESSLYTRHPQFLERIQITLNKLESNIKIKPIEYGSRRSADFAAAMLQYCISPPASSSPG